MMKRTTRMIDMPKLRRNLRGRGRIAETMCCGHFGGFAYMKFVLVWLCCIALDLLIGFRFELLYPVWLLVRNCYDSFRFQGLVSSLQYSLLFFLASTWVWILLVWQTGGFLTNWLKLRDLSISNEVITSDSSKECYPPARFVSPVDGFLGHFGVALMAAFAHSSSLTSDFCRPFAAHCLGYPAVMLGFGLKTYFRLWRVKKRQREVSLANEVYCKLLVEALPSLYEGSKIYLQCGGSVLHDQEQIEYESEICPDSLQNLAICASPSSVTATQRKNSRGASWKQNSWKHTNTNSKKLSVPSNGLSSTRKERVVRENNDDDDTASSVSLSVTPRIYLWRMVWNLLWSTVLYVLNGVVESPSSSLDDGISLSSNEVESEDEMMEQEETSSQPDDTSPSSIHSFHAIHRHPTSSKKNKVLIPNSGSCSRAKGGRSRGRHIQNHANYILPSLAPGTTLSSSTLGANCVLNNNLLNLAAGSIQQEKEIRNSGGNTGYQNTSITSVNAVGSGSLSADNAVTFGGKSSEYNAEELETLRNDLRVARSQETELRYVVQQYIDGEKHLKEELHQLKLKHEQSEDKLANIMKIREQDKSTMQLLERKLIDLQTKKNELEKELITEKRSKIKEENATARISSASQASKTAECSEACRTKKADLEKELRLVRRELKAKEELVNELEEELRQLRQYKENNDLEELHATLRIVREKNTHLEKSLSAENRLKQKLFYALNEARGQMADYQQQLLAKEADLHLKDVELLNLRGRFENTVDDPSNLSSTGNDRGSLLLKATRCPPAGNSILPPVVSDIGGIMKSPITAQQDVFSNSSSVYMPYTFITQSSNDEYSVFDTSVTRSVSTISPVSANPPPASRLPSLSSDAFRFTSSKLSSMSTNKSSPRNS